MPDKQLWILAGANGAGKTTFYQQFLKQTGMPFVNADLLAKQLDSEHPEKVSYDAAILISRLRTELLKNEKTFCYETVFSHPSKIDFVAQAKAQHYEIILVYIHLQTAELNQARVAQRVSQGGHNVPADKIISRIPRTMKNIQATLPLADVVRIYDNSYHDTPYRAVAEITKGKYQQRITELPAWANEILMDYI
ncbi:MAG: zeta toxin family protein [Thiohalomonadales bacterium]